MVNIIKRSPKISFKIGKLAQNLVNIKTYLFLYSEKKGPENFDNPKNIFKANLGRKILQKLQYKCSNFTLELMPCGGMPRSTF